MTTVFGTESTLTAGAHIYPLKTVGNLMGFVGFFMFLACMALLLVQYEPFSGASAGENAVMRESCGLEAVCWQILYFPYLALLYCSTLK